MHVACKDGDLSAVVHVFLDPQAALLDIHLDDQGITNLPDLVFQTPPESAVVKCRITRDKHGLDKHMYPVYQLHLEWEAGARVSRLGRKPRG